MTEEQRILKNKNIALSVKATRAKRLNQICRVYTIKIDESRLSKLQKEQLKMLFVEAKWIYNYVLSSDDPFNVKIGSAIVKKNKDFENEEVELRYIGSQMKQSVVNQIKNQIKTLSKLKAKGHKIGQLRYKKDFYSLDLKQYGTTYKFYGSKAKIQNINGKLKVNGLKQLNSDMEFANAKLLNTPNGYYIAITTFINKDKVKAKTYKNERIGVDFGCSTSFTLSNGDKLNCSMQESDRLKRLQRKLAKQSKVSKRRQKTIFLIRKEYQKLNNKKNDLANKIVAELSSYDKVIIQDEQLSTWKIKHGKKVHHSVLGRVKAKLKSKENCIVLNKYYPTSKLCTKCGTYNNSLQLKDRIFVCPNCGHKGDRDIHAASNMIWFYDNIVAMGRSEVKRNELQSIVRTICASNLKH